MQISVDFDLKISMIVDDDERCDGFYDDGDDDNDGNDGDDFENDFLKIFKAG